ncbi:MAG: hypothetical protein ACOCZH_05580, partial [Phototrophicaceae bacterium]
MAIAAEGAPTERLTVLPETTLNALVVVGSRANTAIIERLAAMLDVEGASRFETVRVFPLRHAAADRVADLLGDLFSEQQRAGSLREEHEVILSADPKAALEKAR